MWTAKTDQTGRMPRLIYVFAGRTNHFVGFVMRPHKFSYYCLLLFLVFVSFAILIECVSMSCLGFLPSEFIALDHAVILGGLL